MLMIITMLMTIKLSREAGKPLGIAIVGGKVRPSSFIIIILVVAIVIILERLQPPSYRPHHLAIIVQIIPI